MAAVIVITIVVAFMMAASITVPVTLVVTIRSRVAVCLPVIVPVQRQAYISVAQMSVAVTEAHVSGIACMAIRVAPNRNATI